MAEQPDMILLLGDYLQASTSYDWTWLGKKLNSLLNRISFSAPLGIFAVRGNIENSDWGNIFRNLPVTTISETETISLSHLDLTALSHSDSSNPDLKVEPTERFHITMGHRPDFAMGEIDSDLLIAGHTHGGQVQIPFFGPVMSLSYVPRKWASGVTKLGHNRTLLVSRGIGMERGGAPELRFLCRPELVVLSLCPKRSSPKGCVMQD
jgi:predicted MPP superfamily phosphohydrolase